MSAHQRRLRALRESIPEATVAQAYAGQEKGAALVDVREPEEVALGAPCGAEHIVRGFLELQIEEKLPDYDRPIYVMCAGGVRSLYAAESIKRLGFSAVTSVAGGYAAWNKAGLPTETPRTLDRDERERYGRHLSIPEVGEDGQAKLLESRVLLIGAGGLGSPAALYLAAAGVGEIGMVDDDIVDRSNLQRQILHQDRRVGDLKVESATDTLKALNPAVRVIAYPVRLDAGNVDDIFSGYDLVLDGTDNFQTRYLINDACIKHGLPNVHGSIYRFEGQVSVFWPAAPECPGPCYRCLFPEPPPPELAPSCAEAGVLGVLPGVVGTLEAIEAIKILLGLGRSLVGRLLLYDALEQRFTDLKTERDPNCAYCGDKAVIEEYANYDQTCGLSATPAVAAS